MSPDLLGFINNESFHLLLPLPHLLNGNADHMTSFQGN